MIRGLIAAFLLAGSSGAVMAQGDSAGEAMGAWELAPMPNGCMVQATSPQGTMLSIWSFAGDDKLAFLLQNRGWDALRDGAHYDLKLDFVGVRSLPVDATARKNIDQDGPGFFFTVEPGGSSGTPFLEAFSTAEGMRINQAGAQVDTLSLEGSRGAMASLARCLADRWADADISAGDEEPEAEPAGVGI